MKSPSLIIIVLMLTFTNSLSSQELTMFSGFWGMKYYQDDKEISTNTFENLMLEDIEANKLWNKSKRREGFSWLTIAAYLGFSAWAINSLSNNNGAVIPIIGMVGSLGASLGFVHSSNNLKRQSNLKYNSRFDVGSIKLEPTLNGIVSSHVLA